MSEDSEARKIAHLVKVKDFVTCLGCGDLISPNDKGHEIAMCSICQDRQMK